MGDPREMKRAGADPTLGETLLWFIPFLVLSLAAGWFFLEMVVYR